MSIDSQWHLDKRVPIALIITLFVQFMGVVVSGAWLAFQVLDNAESIVNIQSSVSEFRTKNSDVKDRVIRIEERTISNQRLLERILRRVDRN